MVALGDSVLQIFVKNPIRGNVKTRLASTVGDRKAEQIYLQLLAYTMETVKPLKVNIQVWYSDFIPQKDLWNEIRAEKKIQRGENLGQRMRDAFENAFGQGYGQVVIIGSDCAELTADILEMAFGALERHDVVLGPAVDGGYYLIGMNRLFERLFEDKSWSTPGLLDETLGDVEKSSATCRLLPSLNDVDTAEDWASVKDKFTG